MHGVGHLDDDSTHRLGKRRMAHYRDTKLVVEVPVVILAEADDVGLLPRGENLVHNCRVSLLGLSRGGIRERKCNHTGE